MLTYWSYVFLALTHLNNIRQVITPADQEPCAAWDIHPKYFKLKSGEILFAHNLFCIYPIILKFCMEHDKDTVVLCAKFQNNWMINVDFTDEWVFTRFGFKMSFGGIFHIVQTPCRADSRRAPSQWETSLQSNAVSHWLVANLKSALPLIQALSHIPQTILQPPRDSHQRRQNCATV